MRLPSTLQFRLSVLVLTVGLITIAAGHYQNCSRRTEWRVHLLREQAYAEAARLAGLAQHLFRKQLPRTADLAMSYASIAPELELGIICDGNRNVRHATQFQWRGLPLQDTPLRDLSRQLQQVQEDMSGQVFQSSDEASLWAIFPFHDAQPRQKAAVLLSYSLRIPVAEARALAMNDTISQGLALLAACLLLWMLLDALLTRRVQALLDYTHAVAAGSQAGAVLPGNDEIAAIARQFARTVGALQATEQRLLEAGELERRNLGMELHDDVCQRIAAAQLQAGMMERALIKGQPEAASALHQLIDDLSATADLLRSYARGLAPVAMEDGRMGIAMALDGLARHVQRVFSVECKVVACLEDAELPGTVQIHLYRIAHELTINAAKHAAATWIHLELVRVGDRLRLTVENDGRPFVEPPEENPGLGLDFVRQRARLLKATLSFEPLAGGTRAVCEVPWSGVP